MPRISSFFGIVISMYWNEGAQVITLRIGAIVLLARNRAPTPTTAAPRIRRHGRACRSALVDVAAVSERDHNDEQHVILDRVDHPVITYAYPPRRPSAQWPGSWRAWIFSQQRDHRSNAAGDGRIELTERPHGGRAQLDRVPGHSQPRSALACSQGMFGPSSVMAASNASASSASCSAATSRA